MTLIPKVLIVDDRAENLLAVRAIIEALRIEILEAKSGEEALRLLLEHDFAVILLDVEMPGTDGFTTAQLIRSRNKTRHTPIIFLTAVDRGETATQQGYALGAVDYIVKPFVPDILRWKVSVFADLYTKAEQTQELLREQAARRESENAAKRSKLLADVTSLLTSSMNYGETVDRLSGLVVPDFADWASVFYRTEHEELFSVLLPSDVPVLITEVGADFFLKLGVEDKGPGSVLVVPLRGSARPFSALVMFRAGADRYKATDRLLAEDLAGRAALAIANAQLYEEAQAANRAKDQFLAVVSHELRTPLNAIAGWVQILRRRQINDEMKAKAFETIEQNARLQDELIGDILDFSRIVAGQLSVAFEDVDLETIVRKTLDAVKPAADAKSVNIKTTIEPNMPLVTGDPKRLQQILWNLLANALKFTAKGGSVELKVDTAENNVRISVRDSGVGIKPELLARIFDPFIQGDSSLKRSYGGLGLGLAITRHLVELHGGSVKADSLGEEKGSIFTVTLPIRHEQRRAS